MKKVLELFAIAVMVGSLIPAAAFSAMRNADAASIEGELQPGLKLSSKELSHIFNLAAVAHRHGKILDVAAVALSNAMNDMDVALVPRGRQKDGSVESVIILARTEAYGVKSQFTVGPDGNVYTTTGTDPMIIGRAIEALMKVHIVVGKLVSIDPRFGINMLSPAGN